MGYLSQKKKHDRINFLLNASIGVVTVTSFLSFFDRNSAFSAFINQWQFQIYLYTLFIFVCALLSRFWLQALFAGLLIIINYAMIASSANLFNSSGSNGHNRAVILYQNGAVDFPSVYKQADKHHVDFIAFNSDQPMSVMLPSSGRYQSPAEEGESSRSSLFSQTFPYRAGKIQFSASRSGSFFAVEAAGHKFVLVNIDFAGLHHREEKTVYNNLAAFVTAQDEPVVIVGDFGIPAWSRTFQDFLVKTGLEVKNHVILSNGRYYFNPFSVPSFNVLAYKNFGVERLEFLPLKKNPKHPLLIELTF